MNKTFFLLVLACLPMLTSGQSIFEKYQNNKEVTAISISAQMFQLLGSMSLSGGDPDSSALLEMIKGINTFKALITGSEPIGEEIDLWIKSESKKQALDLLVSMSEDQTDLQVYVKEGESDEKISSILMFSSGVSNAVPKAHLKGINIETVLLLIEGDLTLENMGKLISRMNLPGGAQLKKAGI